MAHKHSHSEILERYGSEVVFTGRMPDALSGALANQVYIGRFGTEAQMKEFFYFVTE